MHSRRSSGAASPVLAKAVAAAALLAVTVGLPAAPGAAAAPAAARDPQAAKAGAGRTADGIWQMDGYGTVLKVGHGRLQEYQTTAVSCLKGDYARRAGGGSGATRFTTGDGSVLVLRASGDRARLHYDGSPGDRQLRRVAALPGSCTRPAAGGKLAAFDVFWQTFQENYPFFAAKGIDWSAARDRYRSKIDKHTTDAELFAVLREMITPLYDAHVTVDGGRPDLRFGQVRPGTVVPGEELDRRVKAFVQQRDLGGAHNPLQEFADGRISYADLPGGRGYLRISGFSGYTDAEKNPYAADRAALDRALDTILTPGRTARLQGLIIDLRVNGGGSDALGLRLAARLTDHPYFAYAKRARNDPADPTRFTRPQPQYVQPAPGTPRYTGPIAVLTGGSTVSAGETFTQALMERPGRTVRIGQPTQGVFSDVMERRLPNGWRIGLPNEEFRTRSGHTFDGPGIPPHLVEPVFTEEEFAQRRDSAFDRALAVLSARS